MADYLYHPGDSVRVRDDLSTRALYAMRSGDDPEVGKQHWCATSDMILFAGKVVHIKSIRDDVYLIEELKGYIWVDDMFEPINECFCSSLL